VQVGADVYCDTTLICDVLEHVQPEPTLYPPHLKGVSRIFAQWADTILFWAAMAYNLQPKGAAHVFGNAPPEAAKAFAEDRKAMSSNMVRLRPADATGAYRSYLRRIAHMGRSMISCLAPIHVSRISRRITLSGTHVTKCRYWPIS
jgi:glutathione S-transferase